MTTPDNDRIAQLRLQSQGIDPGQSADNKASPADIVARLGAVQAQDYTAALWAIGLRTPEATEADVARAIADRAIVRTWPMRGTLHFVAAADVRWMLKLLTPRVVAGSGARQRQLELNDTIFARCRELFEAALQGGKQLTRDEMYQVLEQAGIPASGSRGYHILWRTAQEGGICFGSHAGKQPTFALLEEWVPASQPRERDEALAELARRYFTGHGPATLQDFCWWSGLLAAEAKIGLEAAKAHLVSETIGGVIYWRSPESSRSDEAPRVHLLPGFDEYLLGYRDRSAVLDPQQAQKIVPGSNGVFQPMLVVDGQVAGTWKRTTQKRATVTTHPFAPLREEDKPAVEAAAARYYRFIGQAR